MRERRTDDLFDAGVVLRQADPAERDEGGVDVRRRAEDGARNGMEAGSLRDELDEHRHRAVRLRARRREQAVCDLALHHHAPELDLRQAVEALDEERRRDVVRQVGNELRRVRRERPQVELERVAEVQLDAGVAQVRLEREVDLHRVDARDPLGEISRQHAEPGADLEHHVAGVEVREPSDDAEDVLVDEEVLAEVAVGRDREPRHGSENASAAFASIRSARAAGSSPRASASLATVCTTYAGSFGRPRRG